MKTINNWQILSRDSTNKRDQQMFHVKCKKCGTIRVMTIDEIYMTRCSC